VTSSGRLKTQAFGEECEPKRRFLPKLPTSEVVKRDQRPSSACVAREVNHRLTPVQRHDVTKLKRELDVTRAYAKSLEGIIKQLTAELTRKGHPNL